MYFSADDLKSVLLADRPKGIKGIALVAGVSVYILFLNMVVLGLLVGDKTKRVFRNLSRVFKD